MVFVPDEGGEMVAIVDGFPEDVLNIGVVAFEFVLAFVVVLMGIYEKNNHLRILFII